MTDQLYVGTHRRAQHSDPVDIAFGIYRFALPADHNGIQLLDLTETVQPGWLSMHPNGKSLYALNETRLLNEKDGGALSAFSRDPATGALCKLSERRLPPMPCHCCVDLSGRFLFVCTFSGGTLHSFALEPDGSPGRETAVHRHSGSSIHRRQRAPHPHGVYQDPSGRFLLVPDLGTDHVVVYGFDATSGGLDPIPDLSFAVTPGSGPRHLAWSADGLHVYLLNEIAARVDVLRFNAGRLTYQQSVDLLPEGFTGLKSGGEIAIHPSGRYLYATTRSRGSSGPPPVPGLDALVWFRIDGGDGSLRLAGRAASGGEIPRTCTFDREGARLFVGHQGSGTIVTFGVDGETGSAVPMGTPHSTPVPVCLLYAAAG